jgi:hypothetical protein
MVIPLLHTVNALHGIEWLGMTPLTCLGIDGFDEPQHPRPWEQSLHAGQEYLFASFTAFAMEVAVHEGDLVTHAEPHP